MLLRVIDIETTGEAPPAEVIEVGWWDVVIDSAGPRVGINPGGTPDFDCGSRLFWPANGISPEAMAVHHLRLEDLSGQPVCGVEALREIMTAYGADVLVAHNAAFEGAFLSEDARGGLPLLCTYKSALRVWPDAPKHSNQVLRYWLGLALREDLAMPPHRAQPDAYVTAHILLELLKHAAVEEMIQWTKEPRLMPKITFGKHKGKAWSDPPVDYLEWVVFKSDLDEDVKFNAKRELERRREARKST